MRKFSYWKQSDNFVSELSNYLQSKCVLEIFAGNGLLASLLHERSINIVSTSLFADYDDSKNKQYYPVVEMHAYDAVEMYGAQCDTLLMVWPEANSIALHAARRFVRKCHENGASKEIIFIGEKTDYSKGILGGCATDEFFEEFSVVKHAFSYKGNRAEVAQVLALA